MSFSRSKESRARPARSGSGSGARSAGRPLLFSADSSIVKRSVSVTHSDIWQGFPANSARAAILFLIPARSLHDNSVPVKMDRKGSKLTPNKQKGKAKKRKYQGNQHSMEAETKYASTAAKKLKTAAFSEDDVTVNREIGYVLLNFVTVFSAISASVCCKECKGDVRFSEGSHRGLGFKLRLSCQCGDKEVDSSPKVNNAYEVNRRMVFAMRLLGVGWSGVTMFCSLMDLGSGLSNTLYYAAMKNISTACEAIYKRSTHKAAEDEKKLTGDKTGDYTKLTVSGDGTWKKRGFNSLFGVTTLVGKETRKVVDSVVKSSFCNSCRWWEAKRGTPEYDTWYELHQDECSINHAGSAGKMEVDAVVEMFAASEEKYGAKYVTYIGDGDSKTYKGVVESKPYGEDTPILKKECVGHVEKRMGTRLRAEKKKTKGLGGKGAGKLTDKLIVELTRYYGLAIRRHPNDKEEMRRAIWATFKHKCSTDENPQHEYCCKTWCTWKKAQDEGTLDTYQHKPPLNENVQKAIEKIYGDLSADSLLERCLGANTQNNNESLNSLIWTFSPKHLHSGKKVVDIAAYLAVVIFNDGFNSILHILQTMGVSLGIITTEFCRRRNEDRIQRADKRSSMAAIEARIAAREAAAAQQELFESAEGLLYGAGIAD